MSVLNRGIVILLALGIIAVAVITVLVATDVMSPGDFPEEWFEPQIQEVADTEGCEKAAVIAVAVVVALILLVVLRFELVPRHRDIRLLISSTGEGVSTISQDSVCALAESIGASIHSVSDIRCDVIPQQGAIIISCHASVTMGTNLAELCQELQADIKRLVEQLTGLPVSRVDVRTKYEPAKSKRLAVR